VVQGSTRDERPGDLTLNASPTPRSTLKQIPLRRLGRPEDIADTCVFVNSDAPAYVTGDSRVMGGRVIG